MTLALDAKGKLKQRERDVAKTLCDFLRSDGYRVIRLQSGTVRGLTGGRPIRLSEPGMPDYIALKGYGFPAAKIVFFLEVKAANGILRAAQKQWHEQAERDGFLICTAHSLEELQLWMAANRLRA